MLSPGNFETDDSEQKQKYEGQKQINIQLQEQKKWLEHELEEVTNLLALSMNAYDDTNCVNIRVRS